VFGRGPQKLDTFLQSWSDSPLQPPLSVYPWQEVGKMLPHADLIVNTTPVGMHRTAAETLLEAEMLAQSSPSAVAYDLIYTPRPTRFLQLSSQQRLTTIDGTEMLVQQGAAALAIWLNREVPVDTMRQALLERLG
jgi:shikimate dehydrogenase